MIAEHLQGRVVSEADVLMDGPFPLSPGENTRAQRFVGLKIGISHEKLFRSRKVFVLKCL